MRRAFVAIAVTMVATMGSAQAAQTTFIFNASDDSKASIPKTLDVINLTIGSFLAGPCQAQTVTAWRCTAKVILAALQIRRLMAPARWHLINQ